MTQVESGKTSSITPDEVNETLAWLDGIAGRGASCEVSSEGAQLREALLDESVAVVAPDWSQIEHLANTRPDVLAVLDTADVAAAPVVKKSAANEPSYRYRYGWVAGFSMCCVLLLTQWPRNDEAPQFRGAGASEARYLVVEPEREARQLAAELRTLGAEVTIKEVGEGVVLSISVAPRAAVAINQRLQSIEAALDSQGHLVLLVLPVKSH